ncbi:hypothetical protein [Halorhodospira sp. 9622]|uniref:hypothetical protein n=1 Tax=Halorhodospira sp. 9622 TaxID=2899136 RepID=UPI001EE82666|nr:hypothetical protein [Halorhodospira sp. 9622]MCG5539060.1 hypothetical protein [Halorhodospira sp. 9622]
MTTKLIQRTLYRFRKNRARRSKKNLGFILAPTPTVPLDPEFGHSHLTDSGFTLISYATRDGFYDRQLERLKGSCEEHGITCDTNTIPNCSALNAQLYKPTYIKFKLLTLQKTVFWLDCDAILAAPFILPKEPWDLATVRNSKDPDDNPVLSLCLAFRPTLGALRFLEAWEHLCAAQWLGHIGDHERLSTVRRLHISPEKSFTEIDISRQITGCIRRDVGKSKEGLV